MYPFRLTCREVTRLVLAQAEQPASRWQRLLMRLHWGVCGRCAEFRRQAELMRAATGRWRAYRDSLPDD